jgi:hypothetical protein
MTNGEKLEQLELVEVSTKDGKATLQFIDRERGEVRDVYFNKNIFDPEKGTFIPSEEKAAKVEEWSQEYFGLAFDDLHQAIGVKKDVYAYDTFNSLWELEQVAKFDKSEVGMLFSTTVTSVVDDGIGIKIKFEHEGKTYQSNMNYSEYLESTREWFKNPQKERKQRQRFEEKFGISVDEKEKLVGQEIMVEVKLAFNRNVYTEIKPLPKKK